MSSFMQGEIVKVHGLTMDRPWTERPSAVHLHIELYKVRLDINIDSFYIL